VPDDSTSPSPAWPAADGPEADTTKLAGLPGDNPLGFFAALGVQASLSAEGHDCKLAWTDEPIPRASITPTVSFEAIADAALAVAESWLAGPALDQEIDPKLKLRPPEIRDYLDRSRREGTRAVLSSCLLAEDSLDNSGNAKPSDLYFTAGQQRFVTIARTLLDEVAAKEVIADLEASWTYECKRESLMWDSTDDRQHAYSAADPTDYTANPKLTNPGAEALAVIGLSRYPCFSADRTLTQGCSGSWKNGSFTWPLWTVPATRRAVRSLLAQVAEPSGDQARRGEWYRAWGVSAVLEAQIRRSSQGGYGTFGPARVVWQRE